MQTPASSARDVRGEVRRLLDEALSLPEMPGYVNYEPVQRDIQQWVEALRGASADVDAARQVGAGRHMANSTQLVVQGGRHSHAGQCAAGWCMPAHLVCMSR